MRVPFLHALVFFQKMCMWLVPVVPVLLFVYWFFFRNSKRGGRGGAWSVEYKRIELLLFTKNKEFCKFKCFQVKPHKSLCFGI